MKRVGNLISAIADIDNLRLAFWKAAKGKRHSKAVLAYAANLDPNLLLLQAQILQGCVEVGNYRYFKIYEPKERQICASAFSEQVLHHALMNVCHPHFERVQIFDSYASRKGKGVHAALRRAHGFQRQYAWFLKLDVRKFFDSIHHEVLQAQLARLYKDPALLAIFGQLIGSYATSLQRGVPIGNLTSQYFANHYLTALDHFIKEDLRIIAYIRYMDDMVLWHTEKEPLQAAFHAIRLRVEQHLRCTLKPETLNKTQAGLPFLGYRLFPAHIRLMRPSLRRYLRKYRRVEAHYHSGAWSEAQCQRHILPLIAFTRHAHARQIRQKISTFATGQASEKARTA